MDGGGTLICVVGPSGAGKDTLINAAREHFAGDTRFVFPQRYISRGATPDEPHIPISDEDCERRLAEGRFFLSWRAHDVTYALGSDVEDALAAGKTVVANISRQLIDEARAKWRRAFVVHVKVAPHILRARLEGRGRETGAGVDARLQRGVEVRDAPWIIGFDNSDDVSVTGPRFAALLERLASTHQRKALDEAEGLLAAGIAE